MKKLNLILSILMSSSIGWAAENHCAQMKQILLDVKTGLQIDSLNLKLSESVPQKKRLTIKLEQSLQMAKRSLNLAREQAPDCVSAQKSQDIVLREKHEKLGMLTAELEASRNSLVIESNSLVTEIAYILDIQN